MRRLVLIALLASACIVPSNEEQLTTLRSQPFSDAYRDAVTSVLLEPSAESYLGTTIGGGQVQPSLDGMMEVVASRMASGDLARLDPLSLLD